MSNHARRRKALTLHSEHSEPIVERGFWRRLSVRLAPAPSDGPACVATVSSRVEAEMMTGYLRSQGINARVSADDAGGVDPVLQIGFGVRVLVAPGHAAEARRLIDQVER